MFQKIAIAGYSGHAYVVIDSLKESGINIIGYIDVAESTVNAFNLNYLGSELDEYVVKSLMENNIAIVLGIGDNIIRKNVSMFFKKNKIKVLTVVHPQSILSKTCKIDDGCFIAAGAIINAKTIVQEGAIINTGAIVEHECNIGVYAHIAPGAVLAGNVTIGKTAFIGANSVIKQGVAVGEKCIIGAGAVVLSDVADGEVWVGVPARKLEK